MRTYCVVVCNRHFDVVAVLAGPCDRAEGYRLAAYDELPRTGLPELEFRSNADHDAYADGNGALRRHGGRQPSAGGRSGRRSTFDRRNLRAPDCCTRIDDTLAIAALYRVLARYLYANPEHNAGLDVVDRSIAVENKWRAQRYGVQGSFVTRSGAVAVGEMLDGVLDMVAADADALGCAEPLERCRAIVTDGTSADAQLRIFTENEHEGADIALHKVTRWIRDATLAA